MKQINFFKTFFDILLLLFHISNYNFFKIVWIRWGFLHKLLQTHCNLPHFHSILHCILSAPFLNSGSNNLCTGCYRFLVIIESEEHQGQNHWTLMTPNNKEYYLHPFNYYSVDSYNYYITSHLHIHKASSRNLWLVLSKSINNRSYQKKFFQILFSLSSILMKWQNTTQGINGVRLMYHKIDLSFLLYFSEQCLVRNIFAKCQKNSFGKFNFWGITSSFKFASFFAQLKWRAVLVNWDIFAFFNSSFNQTFTYFGPLNTKLRASHFAFPSYFGFLIMFTKCCIFKKTRFGCEVLSLALSGVVS